VRWIFLPLGLCALVAVGAHAAADVVGAQVLWLVDRADAFFDAIFSRWSFTAPLVDLVGLAERTVFARGVALVWELCADFFIALPMLGYDERPVDEELALFRALSRESGKRPSLRLVRPLAALATGIAGARSVARMVQGSVQLALHFSALAQLVAAAVLLSLLVLFVPRAALRSLEHADGLKRPGVVAAVVLAPLVAAAVAAFLR
jgi:hypothetical protein